MSSKFNSATALNKTPGVCHSPRENVIPPGPPPPPGALPAVINVNVTFSFNFGFGVQTVQGTNLKAVHTFFDFAWAVRYVDETFLRAAVNIVWIQASNLFIVATVVTRVTLPGLISVRFDETRPDNPNPIILTAIQTPGFPAVPSAIFDLWV